jgi:tetratricopeptide (TPR) repeat protein
MTYAVMPSYLFEAEAPYLVKTRQAAERALAIDPNSVEGLTALAYSERKPEDSTPLFEKAISVNPSFATAYQWYASVKLEENKLDEGLRLYRRANELDPRSRIIGSNLASSLQGAGMYDEALVVLDEIKSFAPDYNESLEVELFIRLIQGNLDQARSVGEQLSRVLNKRSSSVAVYLALFGPEAGRSEAADTLLSWPRYSRSDPDSPVLIYDFDLVSFLAHAGQQEQAVDVMRYVAPINGSILSWTRSDVALRNFNCREDVREVYETSGLPPLGEQDYCLSAEVSP